MSYRYRPSLWSQLFEFVPFALVILATMIALLTPLVAIAVAAYVVLRVFE